MTVRQVQSFEISDGNCFKKKEDAYREEVLLLYKGLPVTLNRKPTPLEFGRLLAEVRAWLAKADEARQQMAAEQDPETAQKVATQE
jgi:hypothetical protein